MAVTQAMSSPGVLARQMLGMLRHDNTDILNKINVPTLVVAASDDRGCIPEASHFMHAQIPNSQIVTMQPSGHVSIMEQNRQFTNAVATFAKSIAVQNQVRKIG
jgi:pimeloyl-ACP methyl ester carboxylesterase